MLPEAEAERRGPDISATETGSLVSSARPVASLTLPFTGVRKRILPWSQTLPETKKKLM